MLFTRIKMGRGGVVVFDFLPPPPFFLNSRIARISMWCVERWPCIVSILMGASKADILCFGSEVCYLEWLFFVLFRICDSMFVSYSNRCPFCEIKGFSHPTDPSVSLRCWLLQQVTTFPHTDTSLVLNKCDELQGVHKKK